MTILRFITLFMACSFSLPSFAGLLYWNVFNIEGESDVPADIVTYLSFEDMLADTNRTSVNTMPGFGRNIVGSGAFIIDPPIAVPEPPTFGLYLMGFISLAWMRLGQGQHRRTAPS